jgi:hypothetical protein
MVALMLFGGRASAATASISVSPATVAVGGRVTISGVVPTTGSPSCAPGDTADLVSTAGLFPPDGFGPQATRSSIGAFSVTYQVPISTSAGGYSIGIRCGGGNVGVSAHLTVTRQVQRVPTGAPQAGLGGASRTGAPLGWIALGALAAVLASLCMALSLRRSSHGKG